MKKKYDSAVIISEAKQHPYKALKILGNKNKYLVSYRTNKGIDVGRNSNRQINKKETANMDFLLTLSRHPDV